MKKLIAASCFLGILLLNCSSPLPAPPPPKVPEIPVVVPQNPMEKSVIWRDLNQASLMEAKLSNKMLVLSFAGKGCSPCEAMEKITFSDKRVVHHLNYDFVPVKLEGEKYLELLDSFELERAWPTTVFLTSTGVYVGAIPGYVSPDVLDVLLTRLEVIAKEQKESEEEPSPETIHQDL